MPENLKTRTNYIAIAIRTLELPAGVDGHALDARGKLTFNVRDCLSSRF